jgi:hypothetical protein
MVITIDMKLYVSEADCELPMASNNAISFQSIKAMTIFWLHSPTFILLGVHKLIKPTPFLTFDGVNSFSIDGYFPAFFKFCVTSLLAVFCVG